MIQHETHLIETSKILIAADRQRQKFTEADIEELAQSIEKRGLLHPIILTRENQLVAGERRLRAWKHLESLFGKTVPYYGEGIAVRYTDEIDPMELHAIELEENLHRTDLTWQEQSCAFSKFYETRSIQASEGYDNDGEAWVYSWAAMSGDLNVSDRTCRRLVMVGRALAAGDATVEACQSARAAASLIEKRAKRVMDNELVAFGEAEAPTPTPEPALSISDIDLDQESFPVPVPSSEALAASVPYQIQVANFIDWSEHYTGPKFNFIHCDFPYSIGLHESDQYNTEASDLHYEDSEDIYEELCHALVYATENVISASAHILFWFPMSKYYDTLKHFDAQGFRVEPYPLIWGKSDKVGLLPDPLRGPRRIYETAFIMSLGDRHIIKPTVNCVWATSDARNKEHPSQKSQPMLETFLSMFVDSDSRVLDPTCGSGTALAAAINLGAEFVCGLDIGQESATIATDNCRNTYTLKLKNGA